MDPIDLRRRNKRPFDAARTVSLISLIAVSFLGMAAVSSAQARATSGTHHSRRSAEYGDPVGGNHSAVRHLSFSFHAGNLRAAAPPTTPPSPPDGSRFADVGHSIFEDDIEAIAAAGITKGCTPPVNDKFCPDDVVTRGQMAGFLHRAPLPPRADGQPVLIPSKVDVFVDDDGSVFEAGIDSLAAARLVRGCNPPVNDRFCPERSLTRGEMAALLKRALRLPASDVDAFVDDDGSVHEAALDAVAAAGIAKGCNPPANDRICPKRSLTRGAMAAFLNRAFLR
jgi:hypothetical protein